MISWRFGLFMRAHLFSQCIFATMDIISYATKKCNADIATAPGRVQTVSA